ncbi:uncharacterized protein LOC135837361 [Planococcus citri]|uniref:uncharacterized protein LOC135837361 n=1 Tax=Planococcus citri TaxID=170843 RepID=UPI0031F84377
MVDTPVNHDRLRHQDGESRVRRSPPTQKAQTQSGKKADEKPQEKKGIHFTDTKFSFFEPNGNPTQPKAGSAEQKIHEAQRAIATTIRDFHGRVHKYIDGSKSQADLEENGCNEDFVKFIKGKAIANSKVTVVVSGNEAVVGFSGNNSPSVISYYNGGVLVHDFQYQNFDLKPCWPKNPKNSVSIDLDTYTKEVLEHYRSKSSEIIKSINKYLENNKQGLEKYFEEGGFLSAFEKEFDEYIKRKEAKFTPSPSLKQKFDDLPLKYMQQSCKVVYNFFNVPSSEFTKFIEKSRELEESNQKEKPSDYFFSGKFINEYSSPSSLNKNKIQVSNLKSELQKEKDIQKKHLKAISIFQAELQNYIKELEELKKKNTPESPVNFKSFRRSKELKSSIEQLDSSYKEVLEYLLDFVNKAPFEPWSPTNCAENHAVKAFENRRILFYLFQKRVGKTTDPLFMMTYEFRRSGINFKQPFSNLEVNLDPVLRCGQCTCAQSEIEIGGVKTKMQILTDITQNVAQSSSEPEIVQAYRKLRFNSNSEPPANRPRQKRSVAHASIDSDKDFGIDDANEKHFVSTVQKNNAENSSNIGVHSGDSGINAWYTWLQNSVYKYLGDSSAGQNKTSFDSSKSLLGAGYDTNGTLLLADLLIRNATGRKFARSKNHVELSPLEVQGDAISIVSQFENLLKKAAVESGIRVKDVNFDPIEVQTMVIDQLRKGRFSKISQVLYSYVSANTDFNHDAEFLNNLKHRLEKSFDVKSIPKKMTVQ